MRPLFGFWLPFLGFRSRVLDADEAWDLFEGGAGIYRTFEFEWFGLGVLFYGTRFL